MGKVVSAPGPFVSKSEYGCDEHATHQHRHRERRRHRTLPSPQRANPELKEHQCHLAVARVEVCGSFGRTTCVTRGPAARRCGTGRGRATAHVTACAELARGMLGVIETQDGGFRGGLGLGGAPEEFQLSASCARAASSRSSAASRPRAAKLSIDPSRRHARQLAYNSSSPPSARRRHRRARASRSG